MLEYFSWMVAPHPPLPPFIPNRLKITIKIDNSALQGAAASARQPITTHLPFFKASG
jgi:hypothetical protein